MSTVERPKHAQSRQGSPLPESTRRAIVAAVAANGSIINTAKEFGVHRNTVASLVKSVRHVAGSPLDKSWRAKLYEQMPAASVAALERSINDTVDIHKAAATGVAHLKGIGVLNADTQQLGSVNVFLTQINALPADLKAAYLDDDVLSTDSHVIPVAPVDIPKV